MNSTNHRATNYTPVDMFQLHEEANLGRPQKGLSESFYVATHTLNAKSVFLVSQVPFCGSSDASGAFTDISERIGTSGAVSRVPKEESQVTLRFKLALSPRLHALA